LSTIGSVSRRLLRVSIAPFEVSLLFVGLLHVERAAPIESFGQREGYFGNFWLD
jgi:hypothetical protein